MIDILFFYLWFLVWIPAVIGLGAAVYKLGHCSPISEYRTLEYGLMGFCIITIIIGFLNFFSPVYLVFSLIILIIGLVSFLWAHPRKISLPFFIKNILLSVIIFLSLFVWFHPVHDTGGYHLVAINWILSQPIPYGLANLYSRLGFNCSWFLTESCLEQLISFFHRPLFIANSLLLFVYCSSILDIFKKIHLADGRSPGVLKKMNTICNHLSPADIFLILTLVPAADMTWRYISTASPDMPLFFLIIFIIAVCIQNAGNHARSLRLVQITLVMLALSAYAVSIKTAAIPILCIVASFFGIAYYCQEREMTKERDLLRMVLRIPWQNLVFVSLIFSLLVIFLLRGFILSGNPLFPMPFPLHLDVPWSTPVSLSEETLAGVIDSAHLYSSSDPLLLQGLNWVPHWIVEFCIRDIPLLGLFACAIPILVYHSHATDGEIPVSVQLQKRFLLLGICISLIFWFLSAPDPRFGYGFLYSLPILLIVYPVIGYSRYPDWYVQFLSKTFLICIALVIALLISIILMKGIAPVEMPELSYSLDHASNGEPVFFSHSWDMNWDMPLPNTPESQYQNLTIERDVKTNWYRMFLYKKG